MEEKQPQAIATLMRKKTGGRLLRWPKKFESFYTKVASVRFVQDECIFCDDVHQYILTLGEAMPICPESFMVCPCGCGNKFRYNKREQEQLRKKVG